MKVAHLCTSDDKGGAAISAHRLHRILRRENIDSTFYTRNKYTKDVDTIALSSAKGRVGLWFNIKRLIFGFKRQYFTQLKSPYIAFSIHFSSKETDQLHKIDKGDILQLNWVNNFLSFSDIYKVGRRFKAVVWRPSDMNPMTGGCMLSNNCEGFQKSCGKCPAIGSNRRIDRSWIELFRKKWEYRRLKNLNLTMVAQSEWMKGQMQKSALFSSTNIVKINNGVDANLFSPAERSKSRELLEIGQDELVVVAVAQNLKNNLKGFDLLQSIFETLCPRIKCSVITIGSGVLNIEGIKEYHLDYVKQESMPNYYRAANAFITTSRMENFPNNVLEASACGIPSIGFDVGGVPEIIQDQITGYIIKPFDVQAFADKLIEIVTDNAKALSLGTKARERVLDEFTIDRQYQNYLELYQQQLSN